MAVLIDPDKMLVENVASFISKLHQSITTHIFIGGSIVDEKATEVLVEEVKKHTKLPVILFPGDVNQITDKADGILFLSLISGRNPEYLIGKHVNSVSKLKGTNLEVLSTGYLLIESGKESAIEKVTRIKPLQRKSVQTIVDTAKAGELLGMKLIYLEAGSGAIDSISNNIIAEVKKDIEIPLIVGGGIKTKAKLTEAFKSGADMVVIGTAFEEDESFFDKLRK